MSPITGEDTVASLRARLEQTERQANARQCQLERYAADLREVFKQERARAQELRRSYVATVRALSNAVEARDAYTGKHAERVAAYGMELARAAGIEIEDSPQIEFGFLLHDVGKVAVPDAILFKSSSLTEEEYSLVRRHPVIGTEILRDVDFLGEGKLVVRHHHERWDGRGYPDGLAGEAIPLAARVFAVADALDALTTDRPYRPASSFAAARDVVYKESGRQFDPAVVAAYRQIPDSTFEALRARSVNRTILIVDDDDGIRRLIAATLEDVSGYRMSEAADGEQAVQRAREVQPSIVFLDIDMPRLDGIEACRRLKSEPSTADATIVMLTGDAIRTRSSRPAAPAPTSSSRSRSRRCTCCDWWIGWPIVRRSRADPPKPAGDDLRRARAPQRRLVRGDRRRQVRGAVEVLRERGDEQVVEHLQLARRGRADRVGARERVPRPGEGEEARAPAVAVRGQHRADPAAAVRVGPDDDRVGPHAVEHRPSRGLREAVDCGLQPGDRVARPAPHGSAG